MKIFLLITLSLLTLAANANHNCTGEVTAVDINAAGNVYVKIDGIGEGNLLCSITQSRGGYEPESCKGVLSLALAAKMAQKKLRLYFHNDTNTSCNKGNWQDFSSPDYQLYHVRIES